MSILRMPFNSFNALSGGYYGYGNFISDDLVTSMTRSPASYEQAMSNPDTWTGIHRAWLRVFVSTLILINIVLSGPAFKCITLRYINIH